MRTDLFFVRISKIIPLVVPDEVILYTLVPFLPIDARDPRK